MYRVHSVKIFLQGFESGWLEILRHGAILGWTLEHFKRDSPHLAGMFLHNSVQYLHWISLSTWDLGPEEIRAISDFAL